MVEGERPEILESEEEACERWMWLDTRSDEGVLHKILGGGLVPKSPQNRPKMKLLSAEEAAFSVNETFATESHGSKEATSNFP